MNASLDFRTTNSLWSSVLVETLVRAGVRRAVISPGSRSTPLTMALARHPGIESVPVLDERSAGFFALGLAKVALEPVLLVCTSGTAAANYLPAVVEAHESGVPLLVITADRPPELRACASGQTIDQQKLYGTYGGFFHELALPALEEPRLRYLRQTLLHAVSRTLRPQPGPVHLNAPYRDPLPPLPDGGAAERFAASVDWGRFFAHIDAPGRPATSAAESDGLRSRRDVIPAGRADYAAALAASTRGLIVAGPAQPADVGPFVRSVGELARRSGWPVLADGLSPLRNAAAGIPHLVTAYDAILRNGAVAKRLTPEVVVCVGEWPTSKVLRGWLESIDATVLLLTARVDNREALHGRARQIAADLSLIAAMTPESGAATPYAEAWRDCERAARAVLDGGLRDTAQPVEPKAAWLLAQQLPPSTPLFIANSMPVRDVEYVWPAGDRAIRPLCNRGANGIDGTLSTALGVAHASGQPTVLLTGDLAFLHDTNGLLLTARCRASLTVVLINNRGGGIFEHLPIAGFNPPFEEFFATPQAVDFGRLCAAYGIEHVLVDDWSHFSGLVSALPPAGVRVLEIRTDRKRDAALRKRWFEEAGRACG